MAKEAGQSTRIIPIDLSTHCLGLPRCAWVHGQWYVLAAATCIGSGGGIPATKSVISQMLCKHPRSATKNQQSFLTKGFLHPGHDRLQARGLTEEEDPSAPSPQNFKNQSKINQISSDFAPKEQFPVTRLSFRREGGVSWLGLSELPGTVLGGPELVRLSDPRPPPTTPGRWAAGQRRGRRRRG